MPALVRRFALLILPLLSIVTLWIQAPGPMFRELYFVALMLVLTVFTRSVPWRTVVYGLSIGIGIAAPLVIGAGWLMARAGFDVSESEFGSWAVVPVLEETAKIGLVAVVAWVYRRGTKTSFNPSDWLIVGCAVGAGFAMVENAELVRSQPGVLRDMRLQYGPSWIVPGAWGIAGYVGHAAATGLAAAGIGLGKSLARLAAAGRTSLLQAGRAIGVALLAWVTVEHILANLYVNTGSTWTFIFANGRLTPWLFVIVAAVVIYRDYELGRRALAQSSMFRRRRAMLRDAAIGDTPARRTPRWQWAVMATAELRLLNAAAWHSLERLTTGEARR